MRFPMTNFLILFVLIGSLSACGGNGNSAGPDGDFTSDQDFEIPLQETDPDDALDQETSIEEGDIDREEDLTEEEMTEEEEETIERDRDREIVEIEKDDPAEGEVSCTLPPDALCFAHAPGGSSGYRCQRQGETNYLMFCEPSVPALPDCAPSQCQCSINEECPGACLDPSRDGTAQCEGGDTDEEAGDKSDDSTEEDSLSENDGDQFNEDGDGSESPDGDGSDLPVDHDLSDTSTCQADEFEFNEGISQAKALQPGEYDDLTICLMDRDYFSFQLARNDVLSATISFTHADANLSLYLLDKTGTIVSSSTSETDSETVEITAAYDGAYYLYVVAQRPSESTYSLQVEIQFYLDGDEDLDHDLQEPDIDKEEYEPPCTNDLMESNDTFATATEIVGTFIDDLMICRSDEDWFFIPMNTGDQATLDLRFLAAYGNIDVWVYNKNEQHFVYGTSTTNNERVQFVAPSTGNYYFRVFAQANGMNAYSLSLTLDLVDDVCLDDDFAPNFDSSSAAVIEAGSENDLVLCPYTSDWFAIDLNAGQALKLDVLFTHSLGNIDAILYDGGGAVLDRSASVTDNEQLIYNATSATRVYAHVYPGLANDYLTYDLTATILSSAICNEDIYEPNDSLAGAISIPSNFSFEEMAICSEDDWFKLSLNANNIVTARVFYDPAITPFQVVLYNEQSAPMALAQPITGGVEFKRQVATAGNYYLDVHPILSRNSPYRLEVLTCPQDSLEPNEDMYSSAFIDNPSSLPNQAICQGDEDWYSIVASAGDDIRATISFEQRFGDLDLYLYSGMGVVLAQSTGIGNFEDLTYHVTLSTSYYLRVVGYQNSENAYQLTYSAH